LIGLTTIAVLLIAMPAIANSASADPPERLRGTWSLTFATPFGPEQMTATFRNGGDGVAEIGGGKLPLSYRENDTAFSVALEVPAENGLEGQPYTLLLRGTRTSASTLSGTARLITDADAVIPGTLTGTKN
jgi:hypothetical protein